MKADDRPTLGLYIHIPFCVRKCPYCDFYSAKPKQGIEKRYIEALVRHIGQAAAAVAGYDVDTVYFGGGTPTLLGAKALDTVLMAVRDHYRLRQDAEITTECNPVTGSDDLFRGLAAAGFNRVSVGLQSAVDSELRALGRPHDFAAFRDTFRGLEAAGIRNLSVDVMFGIPGQTKESFGRTLAAVIAAEPTHVSAYGLRVEPGTPFAAAGDALCLPDDDTMADLQLLAAERLGAAGYTHYEVSNYARPDYACRHNLRYWNGAPYLGFGPGAQSYFDGERYAFLRDTDAYIAAAERDDLTSLVTGREVVDGKNAQDEYVMLRMRLFCGINEADFEARFGVSFEKAYGPFERLIAAGYLCREAGRIRFTERGMYVSNAILSEWLDFGKGDKA